MKRKMSGPVFECTMCSNCGSKGQMLDHFIRYHVNTDRAPWSCSLCGYCAISRSALFGHERHFMHQAAEKNNPDAPITFVKSRNPYIVRIGEDIRVRNGPVEWIPNRNSEDFSPGKKRRPGEYKENTKRMRIDRQMGNRRHGMGQGRNNQSRYQDYDTGERPDMPVYDLPRDECEGNYYCSEERNRDHFPIFKRGNCRENRSGRNREMTRRVNCSNQDGILQHPDYFPDGMPGNQNITNNMILARWQIEQVQSQYGVYAAQKMTDEASEPNLSAYGDLQQAPYHQLDFSEIRAKSGLLNFRSGQNLTPQLNAYDSGSVGPVVTARGVTSKKIPSLMSINLERVPASSSTAERLDANLSCIDMEESSIDGQSTTSDSLPKETDPNQPTTPTTASSAVDNTRLPGNGAGQSSEVGSTCREKDKLAVTSDPETKNSPPCQHVPERRGSGTDPRSITVKHEHHAHQSVRDGQSVEEDECPQDESEEEDEADDNRVLEEKMTDLINALEPLKNISKALIALDHHMRRLLPMVENLTKELPSAKIQKH